jgi:hypothetical protein
VLDGASLSASTVDQPRPLEAELSIRAGYLALRRVSDFFGIPYDPDPRPDDPISITRGEFDEAYERLAAAHVPLKEQEQAWKEFAGWRVNYDPVLLALATLTMAPIAPWSSDRGPIKVPRPPLLRRTPRPGQRQSVNLREMRREPAERGGSAGGASEN